MSPLKCIKCQKESSVLCLSCWLDWQDTDDYKIWSKLLSEHMLELATKLIQEWMKDPIKTSNRDTK